MKTPLTVWLKDYRMKSHTSLLSPHYVRDEFNPTEKTPDLSFVSVVYFLYACASYYTATVPAAAHPGHHEHLLEFTNPRIQNTLLVFSLCSPPLFHLLDLSLVLNLLERKLVSRVFN